MLGKLVFGNPMLVEIRRFFRRMFSSKVSSGANVAALVLLFVFYLVIVGAIWKASNEIDPSAILIAQTVLFTLLMPVMVAGAIAGERERRTWEVLLVAPITKAQIVAGKFIACLAGLLLFQLACLIPAVVCLIHYPGAQLSAFLVNELVSLTFGILLLAFSLNISARSRTTFSALGASVGIVFAVLGAVPTFISSLSPGGSQHFLEMTYPYLLISKIGDPKDHDFGPLRWSAAFGNVAVYLALTALFLVATTATVRKMEEIRNSTPDSGKKRGGSDA